MNTALLLMSKLAAMLTMVAVGWLAVRFRIIQSRDSAVLSLPYNPETGDAYHHSFA